MELKNFNINDYVYVKLTEAGRKEHRKQHDSLRQDFPSLKKHKYIPPKTDNKGWSKFQLWSLMKRFGHMMYNGNSEPPFETAIRFESED